MLAVGARFGDRHTGDLDIYRRGRKFIHVDIEPTQIGKVFEPDLGIVGHAKPVAGGAGRRGPRPHRGPRRPASGSRGSASCAARCCAGTTSTTCRSSRRRVFKEINEHLRPGHHVRHRDRPLPDLVRPVPDDLPAAALPGLRPGRAARLGDPGRDGRQVRLSRSGEVVVVVGDYSFQFLMEEIAVAAQYRIPFVHRDDQQRVPGADPAGRDPATT